MSEEKKRLVPGDTLDDILEEVYRGGGEAGKFDVPGENREQQLDDILRSLGLGDKPDGPAVQFVPDVDRALSRPTEEKRARSALERTQPSEPARNRERKPEQPARKEAPKPVQKEAPKPAREAQKQEQAAQKEVKKPVRKAERPAQETPKSAPKAEKPAQPANREIPKPAPEPARAETPEGEKEETTTLELPSIKQFSETQHQRLEAIKEQAAAEALRESEQRDNPYAQAARQSDQSALFGEVDDRFRAFFSESVAQDSPEAEIAVNESEKRRRGPGRLRRFLTSAVRDQEKAFITGEYDTPLPTRASREKKPKARVQVQADEPQTAPSGATLHGFTISMERRAPDEAAVSETDYNHITDAPAVAAALKNMRVTRLLRTIVTGIVTLALLYLGLSARAGGLPPVAALDPHTEPLAFLLANFVLLAVAAVACLSTLGAGIAGLWSRPTTDTFPAAAVIGAGLQNLVYLFAASSFDPETTTIFAPAASLALFACSLGKWIQSRVVSANFEIASGGLDHAAAFIVPNRALTKKVCSGLGEPDPVLLVSRPTGLVRGFLSQSFSAHPNDPAAQKLAYLAIGASAAAAVVCGVRAQDAFTALSGFAAALCICAPLASSLVYAMPAVRLHRAAEQVGAVVPGPIAIEGLGSVNTILLSAKDLFPSACVRLHGIKTFDNARIDHTILYATSILAQQCDTLCDTFMELIDNKKNVLCKVENAQTEPGYGFTAWIDGRRVIIGSREMMRRHDIEIPSMDYENKYTRSGERSAIYLAVAGKAFGMFIVSYAPDPTAQELLESVGRAGISVLIQTEDFNISESLVRATYRLPQTAVKVLSQAERAALGPHTSYLRESEGLMTHQGTCTSFIGGLGAASKAAESEAAACLAQKVSVAAGAVLAVVLGFSMGLAGLAVGTLALYQVIWGALTSVVPLLRR